MVTQLASHMVSGPWSPSLISITLSSSLTWSHGHMVTLVTLVTLVNSGHSTLRTLSPGLTWSPGQTFILVNPGHPPSSPNSPGLTWSPGIFQGPTVRIPPTICAVHGHQVLQRTNNEQKRMHVKNAQK